MKLPKVCALTCLIVNGALSSAWAASFPAAGAYVNSEGSPLLPLLENARDSIDIEIYTMGDPTVRTLIRQALSRKVRVRIIKDPKPLGEKCDVFGGGGSLGADAADCADQQRLVEDVRAAGGTYAPFDKQALCPNGGGASGQGCYEHGKIALVDRVAMISTGNFDETNLCIDGTRTCNRDFSLISDDPQIYAALEGLFEADLRAQRYDVASLIPASLQDRLTVSPDSLSPLVKFIQSASESLDIEAQYLKDPQINAAILEVAARGVRVSVTVASACAFGKPAASEVRQIQQTYAQFDQAGISSGFFNASNRINGKAGYMHAKAMVVDGKRAWVGSENGSIESLQENREYGLIFEEPEQVRKVLDTIREDHGSPETESWQQSLNCERDRASGHAAGS